MTATAVGSAAATASWIWTSGEYIAWLAPNRTTRLASTAPDIPDAPPPKDVGFAQRSVAGSYSSTTPVGPPVR
jgi:hypothetical protein